MRKRIIIWAVLLVVAFLIAFLPNYVRANRLGSELEAARMELRQLQLRDSIGLTYVQATQKNYGLAQESSTTFFLQARQMASSAGSPAAKQTFESLLGYQETVTAKLAKGEPGVLEDLAALYTKTRAATGS